jgi:hypothetical protein
LPTNVRHHSPRIQLRDGPVLRINIRAISAPVVGCLDARLNRIIKIVVTRYLTRLLNIWDLNDTAFCLRVVWIIHYGHV